LPLNRLLSDIWNLSLPKSFVFRFLKNHRGGGGVPLLLLLAVLTPLTYAADITGTVTNKTTNKPSVGDDVILLKLASGMEEVARTKTDAKGNFKLNVADAGAAHLIRVSHRNVNYHRPAPPGTQSVEVDIYDAAEQLSNVTMTVQVMRMEADATNLRVTELFILNNASNPPRTLMTAKPFIFELPEGAKIEQSMAGGPSSMPVNSPAVPTGEKNRYTFLFPVRPGESRFQVGYTLPYNGSATLTPKLLNDVQEFAVSVPKGMTVSPSSGSKIEQKAEDSGMLFYLAKNAKKGEAVGFTVSGTGTIPEPTDETSTPGAAAGTQAGARQGPGGGLGAPVNTPDPLYTYRWWIIAGVAIVMVLGAGFVMSRPAISPAGNPAPAAAPTAHSASSSHSTDMVSVLKNELFELETQRLEGKISADEYGKAKAGLEVLMKRHLSKKT
jgi:hypothetical protein